MYLIFAYINPGVGSLIAQVSLIAFAGMFVFFKSSWCVIRGFFIRSKEKEGK